MTAPNLISAIETARYEITATGTKIRDEVSAIRRAIVRVTDRLEVAIDRLERAALARMERP
ncbi:MAG: hypothetical protein KBD62_35955 [Kofleriaceae bacterium]|nr:hypothetical protein [Kofleriaceae bacterium]